MDWQEYKTKVKESLDVFEFDEKILFLLKDSISNKQKIFTAGNGGSAALAMHYSSDFSKGAVHDWEKNYKRYQSICLSTNMSYITAIANDESYKDIFKQQLINLASPKDILMLISSSGNSPNIVEAAKQGKALEMIVVGVTGFEGGELKKLADYNAHVNCKSYEVTEDIHSVFGHFLSCYLREEGMKNPLVKFEGSTK